MEAASKIRYVICTNPRTGSTLLSEKLMSTGVCGNDVRELFHVEKFFNRHKKVTDVKSYLQDIFARAETPNGVSGFKVHYLQLSYLKILWRRTLWTWIDETYIMDQFPTSTRYIYLYRKDKLQQAISYYIAINSAQWSSRLTARSQVRTHFFTPIIVAYYVRMFEKLDVLWLAYFKNKNISPLVISYEDLRTDADAVTRRVGEYIGVTIPTNATLSTALQKQANQLSIDIEQQFRATSVWRYAAFKYPYVVYRGLRMCARYVFLSLKK
jgi:trehalose 2-sulfotransferase